MKKYKGAKYIGVDEIRLPNGGLIMNGETTELLSEEAAMNDNNFEPSYEDNEQEPVIVKKVKVKVKRIVKKNINKGGNK